MNHKPLPAQGPVDVTVRLRSRKADKTLHEDAAKEIEMLRDILRIDPERLEIRMSINDLHIKQYIPTLALNRAGSPRGIVEQHAALMFEKLQGALEQRYGPNVD